MNKLFEAVPVNEKPEGKKIILQLDDETVITIHSEDWDVWVTDAKKVKVLRPIPPTPSHTVEDDWVRMEDGLPDESGLVMISVAPTGDLYISYYRKERKTFDVWGAGRDPISDMKTTHWRKLPPLPSEWITEHQKGFTSPTPTTDKVEEQLREHAATWEEAVAHTKEDNSAMSKTAYLEQLENKLRQ